MLLDLKIRPYYEAISGALLAISALLAGAFVPSSAAAQTGEPIKIGYSMALTGGLAPNGKSALLAQKIWAEDTNAKGGLLGRPVKLVYYDDQTNPADGTRHLYQAARRRQGRSDHRRIRH